MPKSGKPADLSVISAHTGSADRFHCSDPRETTPFVPALPARGRSRARGQDNVQVHLVEEAASFGLTVRESCQIGKILPAAFPHPACGRARQGIASNWPKRLSADTAKARFYLHPLHLITLAAPFKRQLLLLPQ